VKEILIMGYFGKGNIGDEAILSSTLSRIRKDGEVVVLSDNPDETMRMHHVRSIKYSYRSLPLILLRIIRKRPKILFPGGGYFYGGAVRTIALIAIIGKLFGSKIEIVAVGVGPFLSHEIVGLYQDSDEFIGLNKVCLRIIFTIADYASVRDEFSRKMVVRAGVRDVKVEKDPALYLEPIDEKFAFDLFNSALPRLNAPFVGLNIRYIPDKAIMDKVINVMAEISRFVIEKLNGSVIFVPFGVRYQNELNKFSPINDDEIAFNLLKQSCDLGRVYFLRGRYAPRELLGMFKFFDSFVGMRLHSVVFASIMRVPVFAISYEQKIDSFVQKEKIPYLQINDIGSKQIIDFLFNVFKPK
jgi:polysaccharide pyruvyl transferase WcaK-like protein